jgi:L-ascorbate metabolism protein UlaG (beta-lactamase superfamily)
MTNKFKRVGHTALGLGTGGLHILVDPYFEGNPAASIKKGHDLKFCPHG